MKTRITYFLLFIAMQILSVDVFAQSEFTFIYGSPQTNQFNYANYHAGSNTYFAVGSSNGRASVTRINNNGALLWTKLFASNNSELSSFVFTSNNELMIAGRTNIDNTTDDADIYVQRIDLNGDPVNLGAATNIFSIDGSLRLLRVKILRTNTSQSSDSYFITSLVHLPGGNNSDFDNLAVFRISGQANLQGSLNYYSSAGLQNNDDQIYDVIADDGAGCVYFCGNTVDGSNISPLSYFNRGCNSATNFTNNRFQFGNSNSNRLLSLVRTENNGFLMTGSNNNTSTSGDGIVLNLDSNRNLLWQIRVPDGIPINSGVQMGDGSFVVSRVSSTFFDLIHLSANGTFISGQRFNGYDGLLGTLRLERTGGSNDRVIAYSNTLTNSQNGFGSNDPVLVVINPNNISCEAVPINITLTSDIENRSSYPSSVTNFTVTQSLTNTFANENWGADDLCCDGAANCQVISHLNACEEEDNYGYIYLNCSGENTYNWDFPNNSPAFEILGNGSSTIFNAGEGTYSVTITDNDGCSEVQTYEVEADCCERVPECEAPTGLDCKGHGSTAKLSWTPVINAISYQVTINPNSACCGGNLGTNINYPITTNNYQVVTGYTCFSWTVTAFCKDGSATSSTRCYKNGECFIIGQGDDGSRSQSANSEPRVYPNPSNGVLNFELDVKEDLTLAIDVYSIDGVLVKSFEEETYPDGIYKKSWNVEENLTDGIYYIFFRTNLGDFQKKVIISK